MMYRIAAVAAVFPAVNAWTDIQELAVAPELSADSQACTCAGGALFNNERTPKNDAGGGCVGGCGGEPFTIHKQGGIVRSITVWYGTHVDKNDGIKAIRIAYFGDDDDHVIGKPENGPESKKISFQPGETITGDMTLSGNGFGTRLGYIAFSTSAGQKFEAGQNGHTKYLFDTGGSFVSGIKGRAGDDINQLAVIFWKPIRSLHFTGISYPTLDTMTKIKAPAVIASQDYCNDNDEARPFAGQTIEKTETNGHDSCFTASATETFGESITVKASIPDLVDVTDETHWSISSTQEFKNCKQHSSSSKVTLTFPSPNLKAHTRTSYQYTQWQGAVSDLPFQATLNVQFTDGSSISRTEKGTYAGTSYLSVQQSWTKEQKNVKKCNKAMSGANQTVVV
jgi:hypothetical protein